MGSIINKSDQANSLVSEMKSDIDDIIANSIGTPLSVYHEIGYTYGIYSVNENSFIGEIYNLLGVDNIANTIEDPYGSGYPVLEEEQVLASDPDLIVIGHSDYLNKDFTAKDICEERGIRIVYNTRDHSFSSTSLRNRIAKG